MKGFFIQKLPLFGLTIVAILSSATVAEAQQRAATITTSAPATATALFPLEDLRSGMKGVARTVFTGSEPEEFGLEILGVLPGFTGPKQSMIIARLTGANVDKTGVFAGMSGSPEPDPEK